MAGSHLASFPSKDLVFARFAGEVLRGLVGSSPDELRDGLRVLYPLAVVRVQSELARLGRDPVWYAFRDGVIRAAVGSRTWWQSPARAHARMDGDGRFVEADPAADALHEVDTGGLVGRSLSEFVGGAAAAAVLSVWRWFVDRGTLEGGAVDSTLPIVGRSGNVRTVEYRLARDPATRSFLIVARETYPLVERVRQFAPRAMRRSVVGGFGIGEPYPPPVGAL